MAEINVTPFVDVMLVLLIIFMVTAPLLVTGVPVNLPDSRAKALDQDQEPVQITLDADGRLFVDDVAVADAALPEILATKQPAEGQDAPQIFLRADRALRYDRVMGVMGELNRAGLNKVSLVTTQGGEASAAAPN
ncbi:biopolymer transport protein TolR [Sphingobium boeckii]|uniref:Biopolymer transport protein TolR n=2 Tax=Sphingobium boeckii TaxID=1082345 RepID=A0A7W9EFT5_9SPHN|nr:protein TolR [Sphingobium boeckii]MBB5687587.1 biopolymer transport protein TolR [Sphingobium boeckii]